jgi:hypothetical protein
MTRGEEVVRPDFAKDETVKRIKTLYAQLYDEVIGIATWNDVTPRATESNRLAQRALDDLETSAMYAVKALTV